MKNKNAERIPQSPQKIGIIGLGAMGKGLLYQLRSTPFFSCAAVCDLDVDRATKALAEFGIPHRVAASAGALMDALRSGHVAVCEDGSLLADCPGIDVLLEASSSIGQGGTWALNSIRAGKHVGLMNSEVDLAFGPLLHQEAEKHGVVCTSCDGDQYGVIKHLADEAVAWGFDLVMAGNIKGFLDRYATPSGIAAEAAKRRLDPRMCASYTDGTKLNIEMALVANHSGMATAVPGMFGPRAHQVNEVLSLFDFPRLMQENGPVVDYILGAEPGGGVYVVGHCDHPYQRGMLEYYKMGPGPYYLFYRPYHLCHIEAVAALQREICSRKPLLPPLRAFRTQVCARAKKDLVAGEILDGIGGYAAYGIIENQDPDSPDPCLPIFLTERARLHRSIKKDQPIRWSDVRLPEDDPAGRLYQATLDILENRN